MKKIFIADISEDQVIIQVGGKCYFDTVNSFYSDYKKCDFGNTRYIEHNFSSNKIIIDNTLTNTDPFESLILDILSNINSLLEKQNTRRNPPPATLEEAKERKLAELSQISNCYAQYKCPIDMYITSSTGFKVDADVRSQTNMQGLILMLGEGESCQYKDFNNEFQTVTREQLEIMVREAKQNGLSLYNQKFAFEAQINACTTKEEVDAIKIEFEMMDFSNTESEETE